MGENGKQCSVLKAGQKKTCALFLLFRNINIPPLSENTHPTINDEQNNKYCADNNGDIEVYK